MNAPLVVCDFCDRALDEDEEAVPIWIGDPPEPEPERVQEITDKPSGSHMEPRIFNKPASEWVALWKALQSARSVEVHTADRVIEPPEPAVSPEQVVDTSATFDDSVNTDKAGATVAVKPPAGHDDPDMKVCEYCAESFKAEGRR